MCKRLEDQIVELHSSSSLETLSSDSDSGGVDAFALAGNDIRLNLFASLAFLETGSGLSTPLGTRRCKVVIMSSSVKLPRSPTVNHG